MRESLIDDAGEHVPHARKHLVNPSNYDGNTSTVDLAQLWPEPDWISLVTQGTSVDLAASFYTIYHSIRPKPRTHHTHGIEGHRWEAAYVQAVHLIRQFCTRARTSKDLEGLNTYILSTMNLTSADLKGAHAADHLVFWAAGPGGDRRLRSMEGLTPRLYLLKRWLPKMGWPTSSAVLKTSIIPYQFAETQWRICRIDGKKLLYLDKIIHANEEDALCAAIARAELECSRKQESTKLVPKRPTLIKEELVRIGPDVRSGADVSPEQMMTEFGLRAIQYGNSVSLIDRQRWINQTYESLCDLADILGMKRRWIGLSFKGYSLALAIGARGQGSAMAHYESDLKIINQTYRSGAGSLAHEYGHALDHRIGRSIGLDDFMTNVCHIHPTHFANNPNSHYMKVLGEFSKLIKGSSYLEQANTIASQHRAGKYWSDIVELFARSFEAFVQDKLILEGRANPWLVHGTLESDYAADKVAAHPYPLRDEREKLYHFHEQLLKMLLN